MPGYAAINGDVHFQVHQDNSDGQIRHIALKTDEYSSPRADASDHSSPYKKVFHYHSVIRSGKQTYIFESAELYIP